MIQLYFTDSYRFLFGIPEAVNPHNESMKLQPSSFLLQKADTGSFLQGDDDDDDLFTRNRS